MSYLDTLRLHFSGEFFSDPSTINNDLAHYEMRDFDRSKLWKRQTDTEPNGWWNPQGAHAFKLTTVKVKSAFLPTGIPANGNDAVLSLNVESLNRIPAKMVDLDTDQQLVSMIFGLTIKLTNEDGLTLLEAEMEAAPFTEIWSRGSTGGGDEKASAAYQSILKVKKWGDLELSPFLQELKNASPDLLSIKFNVDGYLMNWNSPRFATGRIVGTIGATNTQEPKHFVLGRHFDTVAEPNDNLSPQFKPANGINYCVGIYDKARGKFRIDLGNALPVKPSKGPVDVGCIGKLFLGCKMPDGSVKQVAPIEIEGGNWYETTAGIVEVPMQGSFTPQDAALLNNSVLYLVADHNGTMKVINQEANEGKYVRADMFVARMNPGDVQKLNFYATVFGQPLGNERIDFAILLPQNFTAALTIPDFLVTNQGGYVEFVMQASDPGNPRFYYSSNAPRVLADGQVYVILYGINGNAAPNLSDKLSVLVWNSFVPDSPITWYGSMQEVMTQYGNLYPVMTNDPMIKLDLADYEQIAEQKERILFVIKLPENDPAYMPVTRDMSKARREALQNWLTVPAGQKPLLGEAVVRRTAFTAKDIIDIKPISDAGKIASGGKSVFAENLKLNSAKLKSKNHD